jgi:hypothetical protein
MDGHRTEVSNGSGNRIPPTGRLIVTTALTWGFTSKIAEAQQKPSSVFRWNEDSQFGTGSRVTVVPVRPAR